MKNGSISLTKEEKEFVYNQINARKAYFQEDLVYWTNKNDTKEMERCIRGIHACQNIMTKLLNS